MSATDLSNRDNWQKGARIIGDAGENDLAYYLASVLPAHYEVIIKPPKLVVYEGKRGIVLDILIINTLTGAQLYIEKKTGNNGGNAHERVYKFLSKPLKRLVHEKYNTVKEPFFLVFSGDTFQRAKYINELSLLLEGENYAIMDPEFSNIEQIANQIMEIV